MKLRNKITGAIHDIDELPLGLYNSLAEIMGEWEDYKPVEPLIKDEKIRKAVRAWAEANDLLTFKVVNDHFDRFKIIGYRDYNISSRIEFKSTIAHANKYQFYTIAELCGEEKNETIAK